MTCRLPVTNDETLSLKLWRDNCTDDEPLVLYGMFSLPSGECNAEPNKPMRSLVATVNPLLAGNVIY